jgi:hypothetical protein
MRFFGVIVNLAVRRILLERSAAEVGGPDSLLRSNRRLTGGRARHACAGDPGIYPECNDNGRRSES